MNTHTTLKPSRLAVGIAAALSLSMAQAGTITLNGQENIAFTVTNLTNVAGYGAHFSTTASTDGWGGTHAECHVNSGSVTVPGKDVSVWCSDGYTTGSYHDAYSIPIGYKTSEASGEQQELFSSVTFIVTKQGVKVKVERLAYTNNFVPRPAYTVESFFPMRESTGFWRTGQIHYSENGVLNGRSGREGSDYVLSVAEDVDIGGGCTQAELAAKYDEGYAAGTASCPTGNYPSPTYQIDPNRNTGVLNLPTVDFQLLNPLFPVWSTQYDAFSAVMELMPGTGYFRIIDAKSKQPATDATSTQQPTQAK